MTTCTDFAATILKSRTAPMTVQRLAVEPGDVLHDGGACYLVLNVRCPDSPPFGMRQLLTVAALSHADTRGILGTWQMGLSVDAARSQDATIERPEPHPRRWWLAVTLDDQGRFHGATGFQETGECATCAEQPLDPAVRHYVPCMNARTHAWDQVGQWEDSRHRLEAPRSYYVLPVLADTQEDARAQARDVCERIRTVGHL